MKLTDTQVIKECRDEARKHGLVFRQYKLLNLCCFHDRKTKEIVLGNLTLGSAYNNVCSGYISCYDPAMHDFNKDCLANLGLID